VDEFFELFAEQHAELIEKTAASQAATLITMTAISIGDTLSDAVVAAVSFFTLPHLVAVVQACLFGFALVVQATLSIVLGQGWPAFALSLIGLKPILEARNEIVHAPRPPTQTMPHAMVAALTRACEVATESLPLGLYQLCVALTMEGLHWAQIVSLGFSVLATAFIGAQTNRLLDTNAGSRTSDPIFIGFYPPLGTRASLVELGDTLLCGGFCASKFIALAVLVLAAPAIHSIHVRARRLCFYAARQPHRRREARFQDDATLHQHFVSWRLGAGFGRPLVHEPILDTGDWHPSRGHVSHMLICVCSVDAPSTVRGVAELPKGDGTRARWRIVQ
jgi:hypothetical protein